MPTSRALLAALGISFVVISVFADNDPADRVVTGRVTEYRPGEWISVVNERTDPQGLRVVVRESTAFEGDPAAIDRGDRVTVLYESVGEHRPVADTVRLLP